MKKLFVIIAVIFASAGMVQAQEVKLIGGNSISFVVPQGKLAETYDFGLGFFGSIDYNLNDNFALRLDLGSVDLSGPETQYTDPNGVVHVNHPERTVWELSVGARAKASIFYVEGRAGYFFSFKEVGFVPAAGLRIGKFDLQGNYAIANKDEYFSVRLGYYWAKNDE